jgi:uncharacterized protein (TIRG00374 family)
MMKYKIIFSVALVLLLIYIVSRAIRIDQLQTLVFSFPLQEMIFLLGLSTIIITLKSWRFLILCRNSDFKISFWDNFKVFTAGQAVSSLPGGEHVRSILLHHETGSTVKKAVSPVIAQSFFELISATILTLLGSFIFKVALIPMSIIFLFVSIFGLLLISRRFSNALLNRIPVLKWHKRVFFEPIGAKIEIQKMQKNVRSHFFASSGYLPDKVFTWGLLISLVAHLVGGAVVFFIARHYQVDINLMQAIFLYTSSIVISNVATFVPGGLGFTESGMTGILLLLKVSLAPAVAIVCIFRVVTLLWNIILGTVFLCLFYIKDLIFRREATKI